MRSNGGLYEFIFLRPLICIRKIYKSYYETILKGVLTMDNNKVIKIVGIAATVIGAATTVVSNWVEEQKNNQKIVEEVAKQVEAALNKN